MLQWVLSQFALLYLYEAVLDDFADGMRYLDVVIVFGCQVLLFGTG